MELRDYQQYGVDYLLESKRCILADQMGVGKTPQLIRAARGATLVVAPPGLHRNWEREIERWSEPSDVYTDHSAFFAVTSYHSLTDMTVKDGHGKVAGVIRPEYRQAWDTLIFDEAHHLKGRNTGYAKAGVKLAAEAERVYMATGTPVKNWAHELFMLLRAIYPGDKRFSSFWRWADRWFTVTEEQQPIKGGGKPRIVRRVGKLRDITDWDEFVHWNGLPGHWLRRELSDPEVDIELPDRQIIEVGLRMGPTQQRTYRKMQRDFFAEHDGSTLLAFSAGAQWAHLLRLSSGLVFHPDLAKGPSCKLDWLSDFLVDLGSEPLVIFTTYQYTTRVICEWLWEQGYRARPVSGECSDKHNDDSIVGFQEGRFQIIVGTYGSMGEGHTLNRASKMVLFENSPVPSDIDQAIGRIWRFGQLDKATIWQLYTAVTADDYYVNRVLPAKRAEAEGVYDAADYREFIGTR